ncbi:PilW family protein [Polaromonas sp. YR568]|uniref:PilW family protein n=1 Tax=Polaromonas sp. YR568 TaxID=1855301 RepID=UPI00313810FA
MTNLSQPARSRRTLHSQRGMTLVEWMISLTIGLILLAGLTTLIARQSSTQAELEKSSRQIENGRYAMQLLQEDLQLAGYYGEFSAVSTLTVPTTLPDPCSVAAADLSSAMPFSVQGYDSPGGTLPAEFAACPLLAANHLDGTDILVVRRADTAVVSGALVPGQAYFQAGLSASGLEFNRVISVATSTAVDTAVFTLKKKDTLTTAALRKYLVHIYYVSPCSVPASGSVCSAANTDDGGTSVPTLKRMELSVQGGATRFVTTPLVEGIEKLQLDYGFDTTGDGAPDSYAKDAATVGAWADVVAIRVNVLARNNERTVGYQDNKTYTLGLDGTTTATNDAFKRRVFSQLIRLVNPSARREQ